MANASLWLYRFLIHASLPVVIPTLLLKDRLGGKSRPSFRERLCWRETRGPGGGIWLQAVSVGEVELARRLVSEIAILAPTFPLLVTATTATGLALARRSLSDQAAVRPCPLDLPRPVARVFQAWRPRALALVETELWPEILYQAARSGTPVAVINARLSESSFHRYRRLGRALSSLLEPLSLVLARGATDADRFENLGVPRSRIRIGGNLKFDLEPSEKPLDWAESVRALAGTRPIVVAGSTMEGEEEHVLDALAELARRGRNAFLILAPRHPERFDKVARLLDERGLTSVRRTRCEHAPETADVFLIDCIGDLSRAYGLGRAAFIGGSLATTGGHNPLEAAVWGVPVTSGPHVHNFAEIYAELVATRAVVKVKDALSLAEALEPWLADETEAERVGAIGRLVVEKNRGATARAARALLELAEFTDDRGMEQG